MTPTAQRSGLDRFFRADDGRLVVWQRPNLPLLVWLAATVVRLLGHPSGTAGSALHVVGTAALLVWAVLEVVSGESPFRRVLGGVVLTTVLVGLFL